MFSISGKALSDAFKIASQAVLPRSPFPAFTHIRVMARADAESLSFTGSSGHVTVTVNAEAELVDDLDVCLPADKLNAVCGMGAERVTFTADGAKVVARAGKCRLTMLSLPGQDFALPNLEGSPEVVFDAPGLTDLIPSVSFAAAGPKYHDRPILRNLWVECDGTSIHLVASDNLMLAVNAVPAASGEFGRDIPSFGFALPDAAADLLSTIGADHFEVFPGHVLASRRGVKIVCSRTPGQYGQWRRIIPNPDQFVTFSREDLAKVCPLHRIFDTVGAIRLEQDGNYCSLTIADGSQAVEAELELTQFSEESHLEATFVGAQLMRMLGQVKTDDVSLSWATPKDKAPTVFLLQDGSWRGVLSTLRT
ncbi:hypothetical protein [Cupriavidus sp. 2SB]|uniref:hypothetical protein n=1 Tax=Cupriavidus sp. 2SB TaxID=2502199 RepID=UPI0010F7184D|nr:hypothetical protein [Cupriavidus sp. 2SB]